MPLVTKFQNAISAKLEVLTQNWPNGNCTSTLSPVFVPFSSHIWPSHNPVRVIQVPTCLHVCMVKSLWFPRDNGPLSHWNKILLPFSSPLVSSSLICVFLSGLSLLAFWKSCNCVSVCGRPAYPPQECFRPHAFYSTWKLHFNWQEACLFQVDFKKDW